MTPQTLMAACTPNSFPDAEGYVAHGFQINVLDDALTILATIELPDWETFRPASAGHRLIEHGYMIHPDARTAVGTVNGWRSVGVGMMTQVFRIEGAEGQRDSADVHRQEHDQEDTPDAES